MTKYVNSEKVEAQLRAYADNVPEDFSDSIKGLIDAVVLDLIEAVQKMPAADVRENVTGEWIFKCGDMVTFGDGWHCSQCDCGYHTNVPYFKDYKFCPNCGAKMETNAKNTLLGVCQRIVGEYEGRRRNNDAEQGFSG